MMWLRGFFCVILFWAQHLYGDAELPVFSKTQAYEQLSFALRCGLLNPYNVARSNMRLSCLVQKHCDARRFGFWDRPFYPVYFDRDQKVVLVDDKGSCPDFVPTSIAFLPAATSRDMACKEDGLSRSEARVRLQWAIKCGYIDDDSVGGRSGAPYPTFVDPLGYSDGFKAYPVHFEDSCHLPFDHRSVEWCQASDDVEAAMSSWVMTSEPFMSGESFPGLWYRTAFVKDPKGCSELCRVDDACFAWEIPVSRAQYQCHLFLNKGQKLVKGARYSGHKDRKKQGHKTVRERLECTPGARKIDRVPYCEPFFEYLCSEAGRWQVVRTHVRPPPPDKHCP